MLPGAMVQVDTVLVDVVVKTFDLTDVEAVRPVDFNVGVTVAEGFVKAAGLLNLSTSGLIGFEPIVAGVPALYGSGSGLDDSSRVLGDCTWGKYIRGDMEGRWSAATFTGEPGSIGGTVGRSRTIIVLSTGSAFPIGDSAEGEGSCMLGFRGKVEMVL